MNLNATLWAQMVVFGILWWFTMKFVWPPITKAIDQLSPPLILGFSLFSFFNLSFFSI